MKRLACLLLVAGCGGNTHHPDLQVIAFAPRGAVDTTQPVEIHFDKPVVDESRVGKPADPSAVKIAPAIAWKGYWQDRQTLVIEATEAMSPSTRYAVSLVGDLAARTHGFELAFVYKPLAVEGVWGVDADALAPAGDVPLSFNQRVRASDAASHCKLAGATGDIALSAVKPDAIETNLALHPAHALEPGGDYTLTCASLAGAGGNAALDKPYSLALHARPAFAVTKISPDGADVAADEVAITVTFSTPVTLDAARKAVTAKPAIANIDQGVLGNDGTEYTVTADLDAETDYTIAVGKLVDSFGQQLAAPASHSFKTGDARPRLSMERGIFALEAAAKGYPLWSRNVAHYDIECGAIPKDRLVQVLTTDMNYDPWGGNNDDKPIDWHALKLSAKTTRHNTTGKNKWTLDELDLGASCGGSPGKRGVYLAEVRSDEVEPDPQRAWLDPRRNRVLANVTDMGVLIKAGSASGLVWVTSLSTGLPLAGARVTVYTPAGKQVYLDTTNADGIVKIPGSAILKDQKPTGSDADPDQQYDWDNYRAQRLIATVEKGSDLAVVDGNWANGIQIWNFGVPEDRHGGATKIRGFIQSDRGLYRPGESVHFKGIARAIASGRAPASPKDKDVAIEVQDSRGQVVMTTSSRLSSFGGFAFDMDLAQDASLGDYYVAATVAGQVFRERFSVEEFRPASFELGVKAGQASPHPGDRLTFDLDAKYLFGTP
ncbi:MAG TPA: MG2 domain-containing protein, partial [Kofleriaceae bacterium]|nr:MG2 domain-containing protein [Kofleriaceae bacterium]